MRLIGIFCALYIYIYIYNAQKIPIRRMRQVRLSCFMFVNRCFVTTQ